MSSDYFSDHYRKVQDQTMTKLQKTHFDRKLVGIDNAEDNT